MDGELAAARVYPLKLTLQERRIQMLFQIAYYLTVSLPGTS